VAPLLRNSHLAYILIICSVIALVYWLFPGTTFSEVFAVLAGLIGLSLVNGSINDGFAVLPKTTLEYKDLGKKTKEFEQEVIEYELKLAQYRYKSKTEEENYLREISKYNQVFNEQKTEIIKMIHHKNLIPHHKAKRIFYPPKRGAAEIKFLETARRTISNHFFLDMGIDQNTYYPDLTLICPITGLHINIEIDEPYTLSDKLPIHYFGEDEKRNNYFLDHNWCVVRFTEEQVIKHPEEAVGTIISIIRSITNLEPSYKSSLKRFKVWTYEDAVIMANKNYRQKYLENKQ